MNSCREENIKRIAVKELFSFFSSLTAFIFFGAFLAVTLFIFFWVDAFYSRNIADVRPMFEWMPLLMVFLVPALTMRMWSEERRAGTLEFLLTAPVSNLELVLGKFFACMGLISIALALTLPIPLTVALMGQLDWGPVFGGYLASLCLAASYTAIGLNISSRTDNQIVSLLLSTLVCGLFLLVGIDGVTSFFNNSVGETLKLLGSGARFQSITRGVIDFRDLYYYLSIAGVFLSLNVLGLEKLRWSGNPANDRHHRWTVLTALSIANLIACNFWLQQVVWARVDLTQGQIYSISAATKKYLTMLKEPLVIRGYFSKKSHPLLQPLVPRLRDLLKEYAIVSNGKVRVEFIDPLEKPDLEKEANEKYGIKPVLFQTANKYQSAVTNSYLDVLIKYGDQFAHLSWKELIEVKAVSETDISVDLRNPEYDITSAIKHLLYSYQSSGNVFSTIDQPIKFIGYVSPDDKLPAPLVKFKKQLNEILEALKKQSKGKFSIEFVDPDANGGQLAKKLQSDFGFRPMALSILDQQSFWFYMMLQTKEQNVEVPLPEDIDKPALERSINAGLKRFSKGFMKTIGFCGPQSADGFGNGEAFSVLHEKLSESYTFENVSLDKGVVPSDVDLLLIVAPEHWSEKQVFAVDQFLMKGGTVMLSTSPYNITLKKGIECKPIESGLEKWLEAQGIKIDKLLVMDNQNFPMPIPVQREVAGYMVEETVRAPYPFFVDLRGDSFKGDDRITAGVNQLVMPWSSPVHVDAKVNQNRKVYDLFSSSKESWTTAETNMDPKYSEQMPLGFPVGKYTGEQLLATAVEGSFQSYFKDKKSPLTGSPDAKNKKSDPSGAGADLSKTAQSSKKDEVKPVVSNLIDKSPESARIICFASNMFLADKLLVLESESIGSTYLKPIELIQNAADWSLEDRDLLSIRGRGHFSRTLRPMSQTVEVFFEYLNYGLALIGLFVVWLMRRRFTLGQQKRFDRILQLVPKPATEEAKS